MIRRPRKRRAIRVYRRPITCYQPEWQGVFEHWTRKWVSQHYWRVKHIIDSPEDAVQECAVVFSKCCKRYRYRVNNPAWFMALYIRSVVNTWNTLSRRDEEERKVVLTPTNYVFLPYINKERSYNSGPTMVTLGQLSREARRVVQTLMAAPGEVIDFVLAGRHKRTDIVNRRYLTIFGFNSKQVHAITEVTNLMKREEN